MKEHIDLARAWFQKLSAEHNSVADEALMVNLRRLPWVLLTVFLLNLVNIGIYRLGAAGVTPREAAWSHAMGSANLVMASAMALLGLAAWLVLKQARVTFMARALPISAAVSCLLFAVAMAAIDQWVTNDITPFTLGCVFVGLLALTRPGQALPIYLGAYALFFYALDLTQQDPVLLQSARTHGRGAATLGFLLSVVLWRQFTVNVLLRRELKSSNDALTAKQAELEVLAQHDGLTGLYNRRAFTRLAQDELARAGRYPSDTCVIMADIDFFKKVNDVHGHPVGDVVLKHTADLLSAGVRSTDMVARIGGEEFMVLLPGTSVDAAVLLAEKLRLLVQDSPIQVGALRIPITLSFGVTGVAAGQAGTVDELYTVADNALYDAKHQGRNRVAVSALGRPPAPVLETAASAVSG